MGTKDIKILWKFVYSSLGKKLIAAGLLYTEIDKQKSGNNEVVEKFKIGFKMVFYPCQ